ncbi:hypothetical protein ABPG75_003083 [Micractinium tetrahymenae]
MAEDTGQPLLAHAQEDALWDRAEAATAGRAPKPAPTVGQLLSEHPSEVVRFLQSQGVVKLGEFGMEDKLVLGRLGSDSIVTLGADSRDIDWQAAWKRELGEPPAGWSNTITVCAYVVNIRDAAAPDKQGLLQPLLKRWQAGGLSYAAFALPAVQAVIDWKWSRFCRRLLLWELAFFLLWLFSFFTFTILFQDEDTKMSLRQILATPRGRATVACDILSLVGMAPFLVIEVSTILAYGAWGWATIWNIVDVATYSIQIAIVVQHLGRLNISSDYLSILAAVQCILLLLRLQYFSRVFRATRFAFLDDVKEVLHDVKWYLAFLGLLVLGFATSFHILFRRDQEKHDEFSNIGKSLVMMTTWMAGNADLNPLYEHAHNPGKRVAASLLGVLFVFVLGTILLNMLISIMTNTLDKVTENEGLRMLLSKAQAIDELESTIPGWIERLFPGLYPHYLHVLRVDPDKLDAVRLDKLWAEGGDDEETTLLGEPQAGCRNEDEGQQGGGGGDREAPPPAPPAAADKKLARLESKLDGLSAEVAELKALLKASLSQGFASK